MQANQRACAHDLKSIPDLNLANFWLTRLHYGTVCGLILMWLAFRVACVADGGCECFLKQMWLAAQAVRSRGRRAHRLFGLGGGTKAPQVFVVNFSFGSVTQKNASHHTQAK